MTAEPHVPSYWAETAGPEPAGTPTLAADRRADVAVIGGGYTGLAAAYRLAGTHGLDTVVLEANRIGWGASGRNGGFALITMGKVPLDERIRHWGVDAARRSIALGIEAVETVRDFITREQIACDAQPDGSFLVAHRADMTATLQERARLYREVIGYAGVEYFDGPRLEREGLLRGAEAHGALRTRDAFGLHPMKYVRGLARAAQRRGARRRPGIARRASRRAARAVTTCSSRRAAPCARAKSSWRPTATRPKVCTPSFTDAPCPPRATSS